ncbi:MAG: restriction endonuclease [Gammaproteobacteria bacterium]|nr:restriction endonuclease [Gammaproteobacteria bacterium]
MRKLNLKEYEKSGPEELSTKERDALNEFLNVEPAIGEHSKYHLTPSSTVGALEVGDLSVSIQPKLPVARVLYLASHAIGAIGFREELFGYKDEPTLVEALVPVFAAAARRAFSRGLLHGYQTEEDSLQTVRGRVRLDEQIRRRFGIPVPIEVRFDDYTVDVLPNRLIKAAALRLLGLRLHHGSRVKLSGVLANLEEVHTVEFPPGTLPKVRFDRLNEHYREAVELSRLILRHTSIEPQQGSVRASGFLVDMNVVFQEFVTQALRRALCLSEHAFPSDKNLPEGIWLDEANRVRLKPDLTWWVEGKCTFVGDAKYKKVRDERVPNADLYQLLAYTTALDLTGGMLIYAKGEDKEILHRVRHASKQIDIAALDLSGSIKQIDLRVQHLAKRVRELSQNAVADPLAA